MFWRTRKLKMSVATARRIFVGIFLVIFCTPSLAQNQASPAAAQADALFQAQRWEAAAEAYDAMTKAEPADGRAWFRLGVSLHKSGRFEAAVRAYQNALEKMPEQARPLAMYNLGASYARLNDSDKAFEWVGRAFNAGFTQAGLLDRDPDLQTLREDGARFRA